MDNKLTHAQQIRVQAFDLAQVVMVQCGLQYENPSEGALGMKEVDYRVGRVMETAMRLEKWLWQNFEEPVIPFTAKQRSDERG